jgi:hypothetical protein
MRIPSGPFSSVLVALNFQVWPAALRLSSSRRMISFASASAGRSLSDIRACFLRDLLAGTRAGRCSDGSPGWSCVAFLVHCFARHGDATHDNRGCFEVPVGIGDVRMAQVGAQCNHVLRNSQPVRLALLQRAHREGVEPMPSSA